MSTARVSAQVVLKPKRGRLPAGTTPTSANLESFLPDAKSAAAARARFKELGFEPGDLVANSFSITASRTAFERTFGTQLHRIDHRLALEDGGLEFPLETLPEELRRYIEAVTFSTPPDFGPNDY